MRELLIAGLALGIFAAVEAIYYGAQFVGDRRRAELRRRLRAIGKAGALDAELLRRGRIARREWAQGLVAPLPWAKSLEQLLEQADSRWTVAQLFAFSSAAAGSGLLLGLVLRLGLPITILLGLMVGAAPFLSVLSARSRRSQKISEQLPEALEMMARSLRAGHALTSAFQVVAGEMPEPVCVEFARSYDEQRLGLSLEQAVLHMAERCPGNSDVKIFAVSAVIQRETGGNLAEILEKISDTIRQRYRFYGKLRALTGEGRASAWVLGLLPFIVALAVSVMNPGYLRTLAENPSGHWIVGYAIVSWAVGIVWLRRLTQLEI
ncbi:type II secretion system F family protein [Anaeromyxobacter sp. Fw109-5]|uniref:type II secretion system F family protein n=1 Tax=Anaeromyxobacter sp. (strain Fw109-5) TaxID=404589 RepID=UPI0000ED6EE3|nr:type II secretion system F family protein [Anaeromyxobacter sp. Fw109-5]ABS28143.1 type II secretion system protein [Anaeromyxobacter sp. Fw109-5]